MSSAAASAAETPISKAELARRLNVSPGRVSQYLAEGKISGPAIVGEGRAAQILASVAIAQLRKNLDPMQMAGNGVSTRLIPEHPPRPASAAPLIEPMSQSSASDIMPRSDSIEEQIKQERLETLRRQNRIAAIEDAKRVGTITDAAAAQAEKRQLVAKVLNVIEGGLPEMANAIATRWGMPQRDLVHLLRGEIRKLRANASQSLRRDLESISPTMLMSIEGIDDDQNLPIEAATE